MRSFVAPGLRDISRARTCEAATRGAWMRLACAMWVLCGAALGGEARAEPPRTLLVIADGCPNAAQVRDMLAPLVAGTRVLIAPEQAGEGRGEAAHVRDLGGDYVIELRGAQRQHHDADADCKERARVAAVFIALNLPGRAASGAPAEPARAGANGAQSAQAAGAQSARAGAASARSAQAASTSAQPVHAGTASTESARERGPTDGTTPPAAAVASAEQSAKDEAPDRSTGSERPFHLGVSALALLAFAPDVPGVAPGGSAALWLRWRLLRLELSGGATAKSELPVSPAAPGGSAAMWRFPLAASASMLWRISRFELGPSLGVALDLLRARAEDVERSERALRANVGGQLAAVGQLLLTERLALSLSLSGAFFPRSYELRIEPAPRHADTPRVWLTAQLGLACIVW